MPQLSPTQGRTIGPLLACSTLLVLSACTRSQPESAEPSAAESSGNPQEPKQKPEAALPKEEASPQPAEKRGLILAVAPFVDAQQSGDGLGLLLAEHITRVLLDASAQSSDGVFGWRQAASAARSAGIEASQAAELLRELGADRVVVGRIAVDDDQVRIEWRLASGSNAEGPQELSTPRAEISKSAYEIASAVLSQLGRDAPKAPTPLSDSAARQWAAALQILARQSQDPRSSVVLKEEDVSAATRALDLLTKAAPDFAPGWAAKAKVSMLSGAWGDANEALTEAQILPGEGGPDATLARYYSLYQRSLQDDARAAIEAGVKAYPNALQLLGYLGDAYYAASNYEKALEVYNRYLERVPNSPYAARRRNSMLARLGKKDEALKNAKSLLARYPRSVTVLGSLASRQIDAGQLKEARTTLNRGLSIHPDDPLLLTRLSYVELEAGEVQKALKLAQKAVKILGDGRGETLAGYAHIDLARALAVIGRREEAKASLATAIRLGVSAGDIDRLAQDPRLKGFIKFPIVVPADDR